MPVEVALSFALLTEDGVPGVLACSQGAGAVSFTEVGDTGRGAMWSQSMIKLSFRCDEVEGPVRHQSRETPQASRCTD